MKKKIFALLSILLSAALLSACTAIPVADTELADQSATAAQTEGGENEETTGEMDFSFTDRELAGTYDADEVVTLAAADQIEITKAGTYLLTGSYGCITVAVGDEEKVQLILENATISNAEGPAIYIQSGDKVFITLAEGSTNVVSDGASYELIDGETTVDGAIFTRADLTINGSGSLSISGNCKHGVVSKDDLVIAAGSLTVTAQNVGLDGKDCVKISGGSIQITAGSDGIRSDNTEDATRGYVYIDGAALQIAAGNDGIQAETALNITNSQISIAAGSGSQSSLTSSEESYKGLKAGTDITIAGGTCQINSQDDCIHSNGNVAIMDGSFALSSGDDGIHADTELSISGGTIDVNKSYEGLESTTIRISGGNISLIASDDGLNAAGGNDGSAMGGRFGMGGFSSSTGELIISGGYVLVDADGDGLDANGTLTITGGVVLVKGPENSGNGALDYDGSASISGGVLIALGSSGMAQSIAGSETQGVVACTFSYLTGSFLVCDSDGTVVASVNSDKTYNCAIVSSPLIQSGSTYSVVIGAEVSGADANGYAENASYTGGTVLGSLEATTGYSSSGMGGGMGGGGGRR